MRNCQRCGTGEVSWTNDTVCLAGGVYANLCAECLSEHSGVCRNHPHFQEAILLDARSDHFVSLSKAGTPVSEAEWVEFHQDKAALELKIREVCLEFVKPLPVKATAK